MPTRFARTKALLFLGALGVYVPFMVLLFLLFRRHIQKIRRTSARLFVWLFGFTPQIHGSADMDAPLLLLNHQSALDILLLEATHPRPICWVAKKELGEIPLLGKALTLTGTLLIDRSDKREMLTLLRLVPEKIAQGYAIGLFPEGTRGDGVHLLPFKQGAKILAQKQHLRLQPIILTHTKEALDTQRLQSYPATPHMIYLPSLLPEGEFWYPALHAKMQEVLSHELSDDSRRR